MHHELPGINQAVRSSDWPKAAPVREQAALGSKALSPHRAAWLVPCTSQERDRDNTHKADHAKEGTFSLKGDGTRWPPHKCGWPTIKTHRIQMAATSEGSAEEERGRRRARADGT